MNWSIGFGHFSSAPLPVTSLWVATTTTACQPPFTRSVCFKLVVYKSTLLFKLCHYSKALRLPPTYLSVQVIAQMDWCVITMACVLLERPSAVAALQLVRAYQSIPTLFASGCTKLQGSHACYNIRATLPFGAVSSGPKKKRFCAACRRLHSASRLQWQCVCCCCQQRQLRDNR